MKRIVDIQRLSDMLREFYTPSRLTKISGSDAAILQMWEKLAQTRDALPKDDE